MKSLLVARSGVQTKMITQRFKEIGVEVPAVVDDPAVWTKYLCTFPPEQIDFLTIDFDQNPLMAMTLLDDLRSLPTWHDKPVFFLSRALSDEEVAAYLNHLSVGFIQFPITSEDLENVVHGYLQWFGIQQFETLQNPLPKDVRVRHLLSGKPVFVPPETTVREAVTTMQQGSGIYLLSSKEGRVGIFTTRDLLRCISEDNEPTKTPVGDYLRYDVPQINENTSWHVAFMIMYNLALHHLLVANDEGRISGVLAQSDFNRVMIRETFLSHWG